MWLFTAFYRVNQKQINEELKIWKMKMTREKNVDDKTGPEPVEINTGYRVFPVSDAMTCKYYTPCRKNDHD